MVTKLALNDLLVRVNQLSSKPTHILHYINFNYYCIYVKPIIFFFINSIIVILQFNIRLCFAIVPDDDFSIETGREKLTIFITLVAKFIYILIVLNT